MQEWNELSDLFKYNGEKRPHLFWFRKGGCNTTEILDGLNDAVDNQLDRGSRRIG